MQRFVTLFIVAVLPTITRAGVAVRKSAPTVHYHTFDPAKPPAEIAQGVPAEGAVTTCSFGFSAEPHYQVVSRERQADGSWNATVAVTNVSIYVRLNVTVWTPKSVSPKLKAHEEGHRKLDEMMYKKLADDAAQAAGAEMDGHQFTGHGSTESKAVANAVQAMFQQAGHDYLAQTATINDDINKNYDAITEHGTNQVPEAQAMQDAIERYEKSSDASNSK